MSRILIAYYSRTGTTREVARRLAALLGADLEEIADPTPRSGWLGFLRSAVEARRRRLAPIAPGEHDPADYDLLVIGSPVWASSMSSPVRAYLRRHRGAIHHTAYFCTCGGVGSTPVFAQMKEETGLDPVARMVLRQEELATVTSDVMIERFAAQVRAAPAAVPRMGQPAESPRPDDRLRH
jgi:flavodoxin